MTVNLVNSLNLGLQILSPPSLLILVLRPRRLREQEALVLIKCPARGSHYTGHLLRRQTKIISGRASVDTQEL